jgi:hypothetical protein
MIFSLEALDAAAGDSLLLHYGEPDNRRVMLIDGGPTGNYKQRLRSRLEQLRQELSAGRPLPLQLVMVSHIDDDHIAGVLDLVQDCVRAIDRQEDPLCDVKRLWHNAFGALTSGRADDEGPDVDPAALPIPSDAQAVVASVGQGVRLQNESRALNAELNAGRELITAPVQGSFRTDVDGVAFTVVAPAQEQIDALRELWRKKVKDSADAAAVVSAYADTAIPNLSSIVTLVQVDDRSMLLTGDARGDLVLRGLKGAGLLGDDGLEVDILKVPHHGSDRNVETDFFRQVRARHYVISADGKHGNPENATLLMIREARGSEGYTVHLTNHEGEDGVGARLDQLLEEQRRIGKPIPVSFRDEARPSLVIDLLDELGS